MLDLRGKRIIVTFLMHLGDLTLTTPFLHVLRQAAVGSHITYLVDEKLREVVEHNPNIDELMTIDKKGKDDNIRSLYQKAQEISAGGYDILINLHPNERCSFICAMAHVPFKVGASHFLFRPFFTEHLKLNRTLHAADMYMDILSRLGVKDLSNKGLEIYPGEAALSQAQAFYAHEGVEKGDKLIGFNIGSAVVTKRWAPERFARVADIFASRGYRAVFFGGTMDEAMVREATSFMQSKPLIATGKFSLGALAGAMSYCQLIITNDSGPMHVAISQKVPIVAMYGPSHPDLYGPYTDKAIVVTAIPKCEGCKDGMKHSCQDLRCMRELTVEQVVAAAEKFLGKV